MAHWKQLVIYYHSGTGNALRASQWFTDEANKAGIPSKVYSIDHDFKPNMTEIDQDTLIGFLYPTHGFSLSPAMLKFIRKFPRKKGGSVFLMNTRAGGKFFKLFTPGLSGLAIFLPMLILWLKGYRIKATRPLDMPSNWISLHPGLGPRMVSSIDERCERITRKFGSKILAGNKEYWRALIDLPLDILIMPISIAYYFVGRFFLAKTFISTRHCTDCNICVDNCPVNAIKLVGGKPFWTYKCESCMRCMNICPHKAIQTSHLFAVVMALVFQISITVWLYTNVSWFDFLKNDIALFLVDSYVSLLIVFGLYYILHFILRIKVINQLFEATSLTRWWRRYLAPGVKVKDFNKGGIFTNRII